MTFEEDAKFGNEQIPFIKEILEKDLKVKISYIPLGNNSDKFLSSDIIVEFEDHTEYWAVKFRHYEFKDQYQDVTVEWKNGKFNNVERKGDWYRFKGGIIQKYIYGYADENNITFKIIKVKEMMDIPFENWAGPIKNDKHGKSKFYAIGNHTLKQAGAIEREYTSNK